MPFFGHEFSFVEIELAFGLEGGLGEGEGTLDGFPPTISSSSTIIELFLMIFGGHTLPLHKKSHLLK